MIRIVLAFCLALLPVAVVAQTPGEAASAERWRHADGPAILVATGISLPEQAGGVSAYEFGEFRLRGQGVDNGVQYRSSDEEMFATAYIYLPGLAHDGLAAFATEQAIQGNSQGHAIRIGARRVAAAGGRDDAAILAEYGNYRGRLASRAAFIKAGRWMVKLRVTGPEARADEVDVAMAALLAGLRFEGSVQPGRAVPIDIGPCSDGDAAEAPAVPARPDELLAYAALGARDGGALPSRLPAAWCLSQVVPSPGGPITILRANARGGDPEGASGRSVIFVALDDAGGALELVETPGDHRYVLLFHTLAETRLLGVYAGVPTDRQIAAILSGADPDGLRVRAIIRVRPNGETAIELGDGVGERVGA